MPQLSQCSWKKGNEGMNVTFSSVLDCELTGSCVKDVQWKDYFVVSTSSIY